MDSQKREEILKAITPASNPDWRPTDEPVTLSNNKSASEELLESRSEERY
jgi:hypothetical protein